MNYIHYILVLCLFISTHSTAQNTWRGLIVAPEDRCSPYNKKKQYPYSQSVEDEVVRLMNGRIYGPYTGRYFDTDLETDIEHIVSTSEAHSSGLCSASKKKRKSFASDPLNLTLAAPEINRCKKGGKCGFDAAEWLPEKNQCWFANRILEVKTKYSLTVNIEEARALEGVISQCDSFDMIFFDDIPSHTVAYGEIENTKTPNALDLYDDNNNGRITCTEARAHNITPVYKTHPAYQFMRDGNKDGVVCE